MKNDTTIHYHAGEEPAALVSRGQDHVWLEIGVREAGHETYRLTIHGEPEQLRALVRAIAGEGAKL